MSFIDLSLARRVAALHPSGLNDAGSARTRVARSFLWEQPTDPEVASAVREMMQATVAAGEAAIKEVFEEQAAAKTPD